MARETRKGYILGPKMRQTTPVKKYGPGHRDQVGLTLRLNENQSEAEAVSPAAPREEMGYYWGYQVREASCLSAVFTECGYDGGYDRSIGTSERGKGVRTVSREILDDEARSGWKHMIIVFGGVKGLEEAARNDNELVRMGIGKTNVGGLFDFLGVCDIPT